MRINAFYNESAPQILLEEVADYFVQAQSFYTPAKKYNSISVVPYGNRFYTGILQALSFTYLQQKDHDAYLLIATDKNIKKPITTNHQQWGKIWGRELEFAEEIIKSSVQERCTIDNKKIKKSKALNSQLPFIALSKPTSIIPLIIPEKITASTIKHILQLQKKHNIGIITLVESLQHKDKETSLTQSKELVENLEQKNGKKNKNTYPNAGFTLASELSKKLNQKLQLVGYINTSEQERSMDNEILSYISMIA